MDGFRRMLPMGFRFIRRIPPCIRPTNIFEDVMFQFDIQRKK